jgi:hypothetical protein
MTRKIVVFFGLILVLLLALIHAEDSRTRATSPLRTSRVELVDARGTVRIVLDATAALPSIRLRNERGEDAAVLTLYSDGNPALYFNGAGTEAKVAVGFISSSDTTPPSPDFGGWGLSVRGKNGQSTGVGFLQSGRPVEPLRTTPKERR